MTSRTRQLLMLGLVLAMLMSVTMPANAIIGGSPDGNRHPNAGALMLDKEIAFCSAFLISPRYVATAGHCIDESFLAQLGYSFDDVSVTFDPVPGASSTFYKAEAWSAHPDFGFVSSSSFVANDYGLVKLAQPVRDVPEADLPPVGAANKFRKGQAFEVAGYGATATQGQQQTYPFVRNYVTLMLYPQASTSGEFLKVGDPKADACFGDSGGPSYLPGDISVVWGITSWGPDLQCRSFSYMSRTDTQAAHEFYRAFD